MPRLGLNKQLDTNMEQLEKDAMAICELIQNGYMATRIELWIVSMYLHYSNNPDPYQIGHTYNLNAG